MQQENGFEENGKERKETVVARREEWREKDKNKGAGSREGVAVEHFLDHCQASHTAASQPQGKVTVSTPALDGDDDNEDVGYDDDEAMMMIIFNYG